jgi:hypothetical protein
MLTKLDSLLESIDPSRNYDDVSARVDQAINSFPVHRATIEDWDEYEAFFGDFYRHVEKTVLRLSSDVPDSEGFFRALCSNLLDKAFGRSGSKAAFEMVRTGKEGGLYQVLKTVANLIGERYAENEIGGRISHYWESLTLDEQLAAPDEYLQKYGHLLPAELTEGSAARLRVNFPKVLEEHPKMIRRMRQIGS